MVDASITYLIFLLTVTLAASFRHSLISRRTTNSFSNLSIRSINSAGGMEGETGLSEGIIEVPTKNVLGGRLQACCFQPKTGFYRVRLKFTYITEDNLRRHLL